MKIAVIGTGYVGLVTGVVFAHLGNEVICVDNNEQKLKTIAAGKSPIYEPGLEELLQQTLEDGLLSFSNSIPESTAKSDLVFIAVGTPSQEDGYPDLSAVRAVAKEIAKGIKKYTVIVNKSTVPVGTADLVYKIIEDAGVNKELFDVVSNPEFLREGTAVKDALEPDRLVVGSSSERAALKMVLLYAPLQRPVQLTSLHSAELIKYANNSFLAMKISFINAISRLCEKCEADIGDVSRGIGADNRIGNSFLHAGLGWGGSCFPKDVTGLLKISGDLDYDFQLLQAVWDVNEQQTDHFIDRLERRLGGFRGKTIGLLGLAFKNNTDDIRSAKSTVIIERLLASGAEVRAFDPVAMDHACKLYPAVSYCSGAYEVAEAADAVILVTEWTEFRSLDLKRLGSKMRSRILFDGRRLFDPAKARRLGFEYHTVGRSDGQD